MEELGEIVAGVPQVGRASFQSIGVFVLKVDEDVITVIAIVSGIVFRNRVVDGQDALGYIQPQLKIRDAVAVILQLRFEILRRIK